MNHDISTIVNLQNLDDFDQENCIVSKKECVHIRVQQRNGRKSITTVENLATCNDEAVSGMTDIKYLENVAKFFRKKFKCSAAVKKEDKVIQLSGDNRQDIKKFLIENNTVSEDGIKVHGF